MHLNRAHVLVAVLLFIPACTPPRTAGSRRLHQRTDYLSRADSQLNQLNRHINDLKAKADRAQGNAKAELNAEIDQLRKKQAAAHQHIAQVKAASEDSWQSLQAGADAALNDLQKAYDEAAARFKGTP
jgi:chromosome segregation ATPase